MPPDFTPSHSWVCPHWAWFATELTVASVIEPVARWTMTSGTTWLYVVNDNAVPLQIHVDAFTDDGDLVAGVVARGSLAPGHRKEASLFDRTVERPESGDYVVGDYGWFKLWSDGPAVVTAIRSVYASGSHTTEYPVPVVPVEVTVDVAPPPPFVPGRPAEGLRGDEPADLFLASSREDWHTFATTRPRPRR